MLVHMFALSGWRIFFSSTLKELLKTGVYGRKIFSKGNADFTISQTGCDVDLSVTTSPNHKSEHKELVVDFDLFGRPEYQGIFFPIMFHPDFIEKDTIDKTQALAQNHDRPMRLFFAGNFDKADYDRPDTRELFNIATRYEIIQFLKMTLPAENIFEPHSLAELEEGIRLGMLRERFVLCDTDRCKIPQDRWFEYLSMSKFFLSPPGVVQPFCHNTVEAMAVGTVPLLQYPEVYIPSLCDRENCMVFRSLNELFSIVLLILNGRFDNRYSSMSFHSRQYFENNLSLDAFCLQLDSFMMSQEKYNRIYICQNTLSTLLYKKALRRRKIEVEFDK